MVKVSFHKLWAEQMNFTWGHLCGQAQFSRHSPALYYMTEVEISSREPFSSARPSWTTLLSSVCAISQCECRPQFGCHFFTKLCLEKLTLQCRIRTPPLHIVSFIMKTSHFIQSQ